MKSRMNAKVSVIIPAYNAAGEIGRVVKSVLEQTHTELELIVVDDGSKDDTAAVLAELARSEPRMHMLRIPNSGPAAARNRGIEAISPDADYVMFADADDYLAPDAIEYALSAADEAELVLMGFTIENPDGSRRDYFEPQTVYDASTLGDALPQLYKANMLNQVWAKLFSARLIRDGGMRFLNYRWGEDRLFIFDCLERAAKVSVLPECKYFYVMHEGESLITRFYEHKLEACCLADSRMQQLCSMFGTADDSGCRYMFVKSIFSCMTNMFSPSCQLGYRGKREYVRHILKNQQVQQRSSHVFGGRSVQLMCAVLHTKCVALNMFMFRMVAFMGRFAPKLFMSLKHQK